MDRDVLFLRTLGDLRNRAGAGRRDEYEAMAIAALLRKLLMDAEPLIDQVNRSRRLKVNFLVGSGGPGNRPGELVSRDALLARPMGFVAPHRYTVRDLIDYVANIKGAVHAGRPRNDREATLEESGQGLRLAGMDPAVYSLFGIAERVLDGLEPLRARVQSDLQAGG